MIISEPTLCQYLVHVLDDGSLEEERVENRDLESVVPKGIGFFFYSKVEATVEEEDSSQIFLESPIANESNVYYLKGEVLTIPDAEVKFASDSDMRDTLQYLKELGLQDKLIWFEDTDKLFVFRKNDKLYEHGT